MGRKIFEKRGFTLIEIVMVLVIIGLLAGIVVPQFTMQMTEGKITQTRANLENLRSAVAMYYKKYHMNPTTLDGLRIGGVIKQVPNDGWDHPFTYDQTAGEVGCDGAASPDCQSTW